MSESEYITQVRDGKIEPHDALSQLRDEIDSVTQSLARIGAVSNALLECSQQHGQPGDPSISEMGKSVTTMLAMTYDLSNRLNGVLEEQDAQDWRDHVIGNEQTTYRVTDGGRMRMVENPHDWNGSHIIGR